MKNIKVVVDIEDGFTFSTRDMKRELDINISDLSTELSEQPHKYSRWSFLLEEATFEYDKVKGDCDFIIAQVSGEVRSSYKGSKVTEKQIDQEVMFDSRVKSLKKTLLDAKRNRSMLKVIVSSFEQRMQSLISICALERAQMNMEPSFYEKKSISSRHGKTSLSLSRLSSRDDILKEIDEEDDS